jgi:hypothetical protein
MVQRDPSPRGDKNGADINLALDALEMAFTHDHINAFAIVSGDSDFIALVNKLKQYDKRIFVVGGRSFTSTILQRNCHEFVSYESLLDEPAKPAPRQQQPPQVHQQQSAPQQAPQRQPQRRPQPLDIAQAMPLVERALQVLERREVRPQLGLLKSTMLQLDSTFSEKAYGSGSFTDFVEKLQKLNYVQVSGGEGRYMIRLQAAAPTEKPTAKPEQALTILRDVLETHRLDLDEGRPAEDLADWVRAEHPDFDWKQFGFQEFSEMLNYAQDKLLVRITPDEEKGLQVYLGPEFHPPAMPEAPVEAAIEEPVEEPQPVVEGQPTARPQKAVRKTTRKTATPKTGTATKRVSRPRKRTPGTTV